MPSDKQSVAMSSRFSNAASFSTRSSRSAGGNAFSPANGAWTLPAAPSALLTNGYGPTYALAQDAASGRVGLGLD